VEAPQREERERWKEDIRRVSKTERVKETPRVKQSGETEREGG